MSYINSSELNKQHPITFFINVNLASIIQIVHALYFSASDEDLSPKFPRNKIKYVIFYIRIT